MTVTAAVFDFDGTITRGDTLVPLLASIRPGRTLRHTPPAMLRARRADRRDEAKAQLLRAVLAGVDEQRISQTGRAFAKRRLDRLTQPRVIERLRRHQADGHYLILASASPQFIVEPAAQHLGFDRVLCTRVELDEFGQWCLRGPNLRGEAKLRALVEACEHLRPQRTWAYGDSSDDLPMLSWADHGFRVRAGELTPVSRTPMSSKDRQSTGLPRGGK